MKIYDVNNIENNKPIGKKKKNKKKKKGILKFDNDIKSFDINKNSNLVVSGKLIFKR
jgi:hypothetical protein